MSVSVCGAKHRWLTYSRLESLSKPNQWRKLLLRNNASRRLGRYYKLSLEARGFAGAPPTDPAFVWRRDDYLQLELARYF